MPNPVRGLLLDRDADPCAAMTGGLSESVGTQAKEEVAEAYAPTRSQNASLRSFAQRATGNRLSTHPNDTAEDLPKSLIYESINAEHVWKLIIKLQLCPVRGTHSMK